MVCELQYINWTILFRKSNTTHRIHVNRERNYQGEGIPVSYTHLIHIHAHMIDDHAEDPECADTRQQVIMNTVHLSLFPPHEISHAHTLTRWLTEEHNWVQIVWGIHGGGMWFCSGGVWDENSKDCDWWAPIPPRYGRRSACPPPAVHTRPWSWLHHP